ncbi:MAG: FAD binding domain-containing protein [Thermoplasmata archaeon]|nr:FAD binding domain-containing protein [Thermoplasmata archaeon]
MTFTLLAPATGEEAVAALLAAGPGELAVLAGGTDLLPDIDEGRTAPRRVLSLRRLPWRELNWTSTELEVGALVPLASLERNAELRRRMPGLFEAVGAVGGLALRHRATLGGNLVRASPVSDLIPILLALEARVGLYGAQGERELPLEEFLQSPRRTSLAPGELLRRVRIPARPCAFRWQRVRPANDISQLAVAVAYDPLGGDWRVATAGVAPLARRAPGAEAALHGVAPSDAEIRACADVAAHEAPVRADRRATDPYRRLLLRALVARAVRAVRDRPLESSS